MSTVVYVDTLAETRKMYNLEVQSAHTFFVGNQGWLTHNCFKISEAKIRDAMKDAKLSTQQRGGISLPKVQKLVDGVESGAHKWDDLPPIKVDKGIIVDGNHRYVASRILGLDVKIQPYIGGKPNSVIPWHDIRIDAKDWGW